MLKFLDALENIIESFYDKNSEDIQIVKKALLVIEIIKKDSLFINDERGERIIIPFYDNIFTEKEEFDLLKEVLS